MAKRICIALFFVTVALFAAKTEVQKLGAPMVIDGSIRDWEYSKYTYNNEQSIRMSTGQFGDSLYVAIALSASDLRKLRQNDAVLWLSDNGWKRKKKGIKFTIPFRLPIEAESPGRAGARRMSGRGLMPHGSGNGAFDFKSIDPGMMRMQLSFGDWLIDDGSDKYRSLSSAVTDARAAAGYENYKIILEYLIPIRSSDDDMVALCPKKDIVRVGFQFGGISESKKEQLEELTKSRSGGMQGGGMQSGVRPGGTGPGRMSAEAAPDYIWTDKLILK